MADKFDRYRAKRDFGVTSEPAGDGVEAPGPPSSPSARFVVQEHHATRLHWDLRLEHEGVAVSWAIPNGIPPTPKENRLAVHTEDHPLEYLEFEGEIPKGEYGAGTMRVWDRGVYETVKFDPKKVEVIFHGERLEGRYGLFPIGRAGENERDWMIHRMDPPQDPAWVAMPERIEPMLARSGDLPQAQERWSFEIKWDGVRALAYARPGRLRLESRNLREITDSYPEIRGILADLGMREVVLDGEIVAFDAEGRPSFAALQRRMHVTAPAAVRRLAASTPVRLRDLRSAVPRRPLAARTSLQRAACGAGGAGAERACVARAGRPSRGRRRMLELTAAQGLEGVDRQAAGLTLRAGGPQRRLAEDQAHPQAGARDRRLDPWNGQARGADRCAADGLLRGRRAAVRGSRRDGLHGADAAAVGAAARAAARLGEPVRTGAASRRRRRDSSSRSWLPRSSSRSGRPTG